MVGVKVRLCYEVGTRFRYVIRKPTLKRHVFGVGKIVMRSVGLVAGRNHDAFDKLPVFTAGLEQRPRSFDVRFEGRQSRPRSGAHYRLRPQMEHGVDLKLIEYPDHK